MTQTPKTVPDEFPITCCATGTPIEKGETCYVISRVYSDSDEIREMKTTHLCAKELSILVEVEQIERANKLWSLTHGTYTGYGSMINDDESVATFVSPPSIAVRTEIFDKITYAKDLKPSDRDLLRLKVFFEAMNMGRRQVLDTLHLGLGKRTNDPLVVSSWLAKQTSSINEAKMIASCPDIKEPTVLLDMAEDLVVRG